MTLEEAEAILKVMDKRVAQGFMAWYAVPISAPRIDNDWVEICAVTAPREQAVMLAVAMLTS